MLQYAVGCQTVISFLDSWGSKTVGGEDRDQVTILDTEILCFVFLDPATVKEVITARSLSVPVSCRIAVCLLVLTTSYWNLNPWVWNQDREDD